MSTPKRKKPRELPKGIERALVQRKPSADSEQLLLDIIEVWGGTHKLAMDLHKEFQEAKAGSMVRQRILETIHRLIVNNTNHQIGQTRKPDDMTDDELDETAMSYTKRLTNAPSST